MLYILRSSVISIIKYVLIPLATVPFRLFSYCIPKSNKLWVYGCHAGKEFSGNSRFFYRYARKNATDITHVVITHSQKIKRQLENKKISVEMAYSLKGLWYVLRAKKCFVTNMVKDDLNYLTVSNRLEVVELWHGIPIKSIRWRHSKPAHAVRTIANYQIPKPSIWISTYNQPVKDTPQVFDLKRQQIKAFGYPRNDIFFNKEKFPEVEKIIGSKKYKHVLVYVPTFRKPREPMNPFSNEWWQELNKLCKKNNWLFVTKKHLLQTKLIVPSNLSNVLDVSSKVETLQPLLKYATAMVTDYSSACIDFALTAKPIIFYPADLESYQKINPLCINYKKDLPGPFADSPQELLKLIGTIDEWSQEKKYRDSYALFVKKFHKNIDGNASKRLFDYVYTNQQ